MKKLYLLTLLLLFFNVVVSAQVSKGEYAEMVYNILFSQNNNPDNYTASTFPNPFLDINGDSDFGKKIILLSYLDWEDGITAYTREPNFLPSLSMRRAEAIRIIIEAYGIQTSFSTSSPFNDVFPGDPYYGYLYTAWDIGMIPGGTIEPTLFIDLAEAQDNITWVANSQYHPISESQLENLNNYFVPNTFEPQNLGFLRGIEQGVFSHYAKNSFVIPDIKFNLNFSHYYSTQLVELPEVLFPIKPLGRGWTHTYDSYIRRVEGVDGGDDLYYIKWPDGSVHIYNDNENEYITLGVYDTLTEQDGGDDVIITTKNQIEYFFDRLNNNVDIFYLRRITDRNDNRIFISYETSEENSDFKRIRFVKSPSDKQIDFNYLEGTDLIQSITDPINREISFEYNEERLRYFNDAKNQETRYSYVSNDEDAPEEHQYKRFLLRKVRLPRGNEIEAEYDNDNNGKLEQYTINDNVPVNIDLVIDFDSQTPLVADVTVPMPEGGTQNFNYEFDENGLLNYFENDVARVNLSYPSPTSNNPLLPLNIDNKGLDMFYEYDNQGNVTSIRVEDNEDSDFFYNNDNDLILYRDENGNETEFNYDDNGNLLSVSDPLGGQVNYSYDSFGQVQSVTNQEGISVNYTYEDDGVVSTMNAPEGISSSFQYDGVNRLLSRNDNGLTTSYSYDPNDNIEVITNSGGLVTSFDYDQNDNLATITNANGVNTVFQYNDKDQVISETFGALTKQYLYNNDGTLERYIKPSGDEVLYEYTSAGMLNSAGTITDVDYYSEDDRRDGLVKSIASTAIRYNFIYDNLNRLDEVIKETSGEKVRYEYDNIGNITRIYYPNITGFYVEYFYDAKNRIDKVETSLLGIRNLISEYSYRGDDLISSINYGNGITTNYSYDSAGRKVGITHLNPSGETMYSELLTLDSRGNVLSSNIGYESSLELSDFEPLDQPQSFNYNNNNHIQGAGYAVNNDGNLTNGDSETYVYDIDDQLTNRNTGEGEINYTYDPYGNRISRVDENFNKVYEWDILNQNIIQQTDENGNNIRNYIYGLGLEARFLNNELIVYYHADTRGNIVYVTDEDGVRIQDYRYDDFGRPQRVNPGPNPDNNEFTFLGKYGIIEDDREKSLYYIRARYYDADLGRFLTEDPIWNENLYSYSNNNPISYLDTNGKNYFSYNQQAYRNDLFGYTAVSSEKITAGAERIARLTFDRLEYSGLGLAAVGGALSLTKVGAPVGIPLFAAGGLTATLGGVGNGILDIIVYDDNSKLSRVVAFEVFEFFLGKYLKILKVTPADELSAELIFTIFSTAVDEYYAKEKQ